MFNIFSFSVLYEITKTLKKRLETTRKTETLPTMSALSPGAHCCGCLPSNVPAEIRRLSVLLIGKVINFSKWNSDGNPFKIINLRSFEKLQAYNDAEWGLWIKTCGILMAVLHQQSPSVVPLLQNCMLLGTQTV